MSSLVTLYCFCIVGIATLTMLVSSTDMNIPTTTTANGSPQLAVCTDLATSTGAARRSTGRLGSPLGTSTWVVLGWPGTKSPNERVGSRSKRPRRWSGPPGRRAARTSVNA